MILAKVNQAKTPIITKIINPITRSTSLRVCLACFWNGVTRASTTLDNCLVSTSLTNFTITDEICSTLFCVLGGVGVFISGFVSFGISCIAMHGIIQGKISYVKIVE